MSAEGSVRQTPPAVGTPAPDFELEDQHGTPLRLSALRGRPVLLVFFPHAFTPTCTGELCAVRDELAETDEQASGLEGVQVVGVSCDPSPALRVFAQREGITYPLLSDFWPHGDVSRAYGVFFEPRGFATRGTFLLDAEGLVRWSVVNGPGEARDPADYRAAVAALAEPVP
ncbi:peroxiredoxin [Motilibacter deserti]|uniref:thioredoxin-dependent peroxiredoxin n=1 Tax=Motilibacter deserti TaxID=2714956 RepID=A0ABX0GS31_9ACTN|nr:peroxiredoxin [Motilibacter deserti]NHC12527.1 peroxiredoxin [Motilibacter deserti]